MDQYLKYKDLFEKIYLEDEIMINEDMKNHIYFKVGGPKDISNLVNFLASQESDYITGQVIKIDGGLS